VRPNGSRLSCGRACTTLAPTGRRRRSYPAPDGGRPLPPHATDRGRQLQPLVRRRAALPAAIAVREDIAHRLLRRVADRGHEAVTGVDAGKRKTLEFWVAAPVDGLEPGTNGMHENPRPATLSDTRELGSRLMKLAAAALQPERPPRREFAPLDFQGGLEPRRARCCWPSVEATEWRTEQGSPGSRRGQQLERLVRAASPPGAVERRRRKRRMQ
jgi:hypothetical protein